MTTNIKISIVIPVYNRGWCVRRAVDSAVQFIGNENDAEIVLVDDGSTDTSFVEINDAVNSYSTLNSVSFKVHRHEKNQGVCAAKNSGARMATGVWVVFFDSDDELMPNGLFQLKQCLKKHDSTALHFFTAIGEHATFNAKRKNLTKSIDFFEYLTVGLGGEALPVVRREAFLRFPYDENIRGYESLAYMRLVKHYGSLASHTLGLRRYHTSHQDRLSSVINMRRRAKDLYVGHLRALREHYKEAPILWSIKQLARAANALLR